MYHGPESSVFFINEGSVDPRRSRIFAEQDEGVSVGVGFSLVRTKSGCRMGGLLVNRIPFPHSPPHHRFVVHPVCDKACGVEAAFMAHFHRAEVGGYVVLEPGGMPDYRGIMHYAAYLWAACPPRSPLHPLSSALASSPSSSSHHRFLAPGCDGSICLDEGVLTWSLKVPQVMGGRLNEHSFARVSELYEDIGDVGDDEAA